MSRKFVKVLTLLTTLLTLSMIFQEVFMKQNDSSESNTLWTIFIVIVSVIVGICFFLCRWLGSHSCLLMVLTECVNEYESNSFFKCVKCDFNCTICGNDSAFVTFYVEFVECFAEIWRYFCGGAVRFLKTCVNPDTRVHIIDLPRDDEIRYGNNGERVLRNGITGDVTRLPRLNRTEAENDTPMVSMKMEKWGGS